MSAPTPPAPIPPAPPLTRLGAIAFLAREGAITAAEAHALTAGDALADLYDEIAPQGVPLLGNALADIGDLLRAGDLAEAIIQLGRMHPALRDLPHLHAKALAGSRAP